MYSIRPGLMIGFHGCDEEIRDAVIAGKAELQPSINEYDWLGSGIYFWENNANRALQFAKELQSNLRKGKSQINKPAVLGAVFTLGTCLDLLDSEYLQLMRESHRNLEISAKTVGVDLPENKRASSKENDLLLRYLDCAVIEHLHRRVETKFDSVRGVFIEGDTLYPTSGFNDKNHIQICIRNTNCI